MAGATRITLPAPSRPTGGLLSAARPLEGEWWRGITFSSGQCLVPQTIGTGCDDTEPFTEKEPQRPGDAVTFETFAVVASIDCTTMGRTDVATFAEQTLEATREFAAGAEFMSGVSTPNPSLADATDLGTVLDPVGALSCLEQKAAQALSGRLAFIHASPAIANAWMAESAIRLDGRTWRTALGSVVVVSAGYDGRAPAGSASVAPVDGESLYAYATGEVYAAWGNRETLDAVDRSVNTRIAHSEEVVMVAFDPCFNVAIGTGVLLCDFEEVS